MLDLGHHIDEVADFSTAAVLSVIDNDLKIKEWKFSLQSLNYAEHRVVGGGNTKDDLKFGILLIAE